MQEFAPRERAVIILGSTGSIGTQALDVISRHRDSYRVVGLGAGGANLELLADQAISFNVPVLAVANPDAAVPLAALLAERAPGQLFQILSGPDAMSELAGGWASLSTNNPESVGGPLRGQATSSSAPMSTSTHSSDSVVVLNGFTGSVGLQPTLTALRSGATLALANKESLVVGGGLIKEAMTRPGQIVPVDSEHSAIAQALRSGAPVIAAVRPGTFTNVGHYIVLYGIDDANQIGVYDPNSASRSARRWGVVEVLNEIEAMWAYY